MPLHRPGGLHLDPSRAHDPRLGAEHVRQAAPAAAVQYRAADAWPLSASHQPDGWEDWMARVICGEADLCAAAGGGPGAPAVAAAQIAGSIYETQREVKNSYFAQPAPAAAS